MSEEENKRYFFNFSFFKVDPKWRWMADLAKEESARELENVLANLPIKTRTYSTLGLRDDADFLIWFMSESVEEIQDAISKYQLDVESHTFPNSNHSTKMDEEIWVLVVSSGLVLN